MNIAKSLVVLLFSVASLAASGQVNYVDSVLQSCGQLETDSAKYECFYNQNILQLFAEGKYQVAIDLLESIEQEDFILNDPSSNLTVQAGLGTLNLVMANSEASIEHFSRAIDLCDSFEVLRPQKPRIVSKLAVVFSDLGKVEKAKSLYREAIDELLLTNDSLELDYSHFFNLGAEYLNQDSVVPSIPLFRKARQICEMNKDTAGLINCWTALSSVLTKQGNYDRARYNSNKALQMSLVIGDSLGYANGLLANADILDKEERYEEAIALENEALQMFERFGKTNRYLEITKASAKKYVKAELFKDAALFYERYVDVSDSLRSAEATTQLAEFEAKYETAKKESQIKLLEQEQATRKAQEEKKNLLLWFGGVGVVLLVAFLLFVYSRLRLVRRQKQVIEKQKKLVDDQRTVLQTKNDQIVDSIDYARLIQKAVIPTEAQIKSNFDDAFVLYKPKDIVSGDFYWQQKVGDLLFFSVADCTGHGVPGAFMSMIGISLLDKAVLELELRSPEVILDRMNQDLYERLHVSEKADVKDGMDLFVCCLDTKTNRLLAAGAYNPMYVIRDGELTQFKGDKLHLGNLEHTKGKSYTLCEMELQKGDAVYLFTDGYADQKGGPNKKKFYYQPFRQLLIDLSKKPMAEQKQVLYDTYQNWKGDLKQIDDMCVMGVRI